MQNFMPPQREIKTYWKKTRRDAVGGPSNVFTRKTIVEETFNRKFTNICKSIVGSDATQPYPYSICQPMPTGLYTHWDIESETSGVTRRQKETRSFEKMLMSYFQRTRLDYKIEIFHTKGRQKKIERFSFNRFCSHCNIVFEARSCFYHFCSCQELCPSLAEEDFKGGSQKRELDELRRGYKREKSFTVPER